MKIIKINKNYLLPRVQFPARDVSHRSSIWGLKCNQYFGQSLYMVRWIIIGGRAPSCSKEKLIMVLPSPSFSLLYGRLQYYNSFISKTLHTSTRCQFVSLWSSTVFWLSGFEFIDKSRRVNWKHIVAWRNSRFGTSLSFVNLTFLHVRGAHCRSKFCAGCVEANATKQWLHCCSGLR